MIATRISGNKVRLKACDVRAYSSIKSFQNVTIYTNYGIVENVETRREESQAWK
jgi:hypothetical protein